MSSGTTVEIFFDCSSQWTKLAFHNIRAISPDLSEVFALSIFQFRYESEEGLIGRYLVRRLTGLKRAV